MTTAARTVLDLTRAGHEPAHLTDLMDDAVSQRLTTKNELATVLSDVARIFGASGTSTQAMRDRLDELLPEEKSHEEDLTRVVQQAMAPIQRQLQELFSQITPQLRLADLSTTASSVQNVLDREAE